MKTQNLNIGAFVVAWRLSAFGIDGNHYNRYNYKQFSKALKEILPHKFYAAVYDKKDRLYFGIFDTEAERVDWLEKWFEENPEDEAAGTAKYKDLKSHALDDLDSIGCYSLLSDTNGVLFTTG